MTTLIPRKELFGNPEIYAVKINADGKFISWLAPKNNVMNIWCAPLDNIENKVCITHESLRPISRFHWSKHPDYIFYYQDNNGDENWHIHSVNIHTKVDIDLTDISGVNAEIISMSWHSPQYILIGLNDRDSRWHDIYKIDITTGEKKLLILNDNEYSRFIFDENYDVKLVEKSIESEGIRVIYKRVNEEWIELTRIKHESSWTTYVSHFESSGEYFYMVDSREVDKSVLTKIRFEDGKKEIIAKSDKADIDKFMMHPVSYEIEAWSYNYLRPKWFALVDTIEVDFVTLNAKFGESYTIGSRTKDNNRWIILVRDATHAGTYYLYERHTKNISKLFDMYPNLKQYTLLLMYDFTIQARDGLLLTSYLTMPEGVTLDDKMVSNNSVPMVLLVHGGPLGRDEYGYNRIHQWLANRGYAVLSVNFRGSTGFGKNFINKADGEWSGKMHDDLIDAVDWATAQGIADKNRVAIMGRSYGGYATLVGLSYTPEVFCCGIDVVGPSNLETLLNTIPAYWQSFYAELVRRIGGDPKTSEGLAYLKKCSPLYKVNNIRKPLLIGQGANDPRVKQAESDQIVSAMKKRNLPVTYVVYSDEGHVWTRPENHLSFNALIEKFLATNLGGRCEPIGDAFEGSSIEIREGSIE